MRAELIAAFVLMLYTFAKAEDKNAQSPRKCNLLEVYVLRLMNAYITSETDHLPSFKPYKMGRIEFNEGWGWFFVNNLTLSGMEHMKVLEMHTSRPVDRFMIKFYIPTLEMKSDGYFSRYNGGHTALLELKNLTVVADLGLQFQPNETIFWEKTGFSVLGNITKYTFENTNEETLGHIGKSLENTLKNGNDTLQVFAEPVKFAANEFLTQYPVYEMIKPFHEYLLEIKANMTLYRRNLCFEMPLSFEVPDVDDEWPFEIQKLKSWFG